MGTNSQQKSNDIVSYYTRFGYGIVLYRSNNQHLISKTDSEIYQELHDEFDAQPAAHVSHNVQVNVKENIIFVNFNRIDEVIDLFDTFGNPIKPDLNYKLNWRSFPFKALLVNNKGFDVGKTLQYIKNYYPIRFVPIKTSTYYAVLRIHRQDDLDTLIQISQFYNEAFHVLVQHSDQVRWIPRDKYGIKLLIKHVMSIERLHLGPLSKITYDISNRLKLDGEEGQNAIADRYLENAFRINGELFQSIQNLKYNLMELNIKTHLQEG